jgi:TPR repeat protein
MKTRLCLLVGAVLAGSLAPQLHAQYLAPRQYLRRLDPNVPPPRPAPPPNPGLPPGPVVSPPPALPAAPATNTARLTPAQIEAQKRAVELLRQRAEAGNASAQYELAMRYLNGKGVEKNPAEARKWLTAAAKQDYVWAKKKLEELAAAGELSATTDLPAAAPAAPKPSSPEAPDKAPPAPGTGADQPAPGPEAASPTPSPAAGVKRSE